LINTREKVETLIAGDTIILTNGVWKDAKLVFKGTGEMDKQIYLMAETPGKVTLEGKSSLQISGKWLQVSGLVFVNGSSPKGTVIDFRTSSKDYAYNCILTNCVIDKYNLATKDSADHWIGLYGKITPSNIVTLEENQTKEQLWWSGLTIQIR